VTTDGPLAIDAAIDAAPPSPRRVFITPLPYPTNFAVGEGSATAFADERCKFWGESLGSTRPWIAWLSTASSAAIDRFTSDGPWQRLDGMPIATNRADLLDGTLANAISLNVYGMPVVNRALTGTGTNGRIENEGPSLATCNEWTSNDTAIRYTFGLTDVANAQWTTSTFFPSCGVQLPFLCFEQ
jgi:hypothetical protein